MQQFLSGIDAKTFDFTVRWHTIDPSLVRELWDMQRTSSTWNSRCRDFVLSHLGDDIQFFLEGEQLVPSHEFAHIVDSAWKSIIPDIYDCLTVFGVVPLTFRRLSPGNSATPFVPVVPKPFTYVLQVAYTIEYGLMFRVLRPISMYADPDTAIEHDEQYERYEFVRPKVIVADTTYYSACGGFTDDYNFVLGLGGDDDEADTFISNMKTQFSSDIPRGYVLDRNTIVLHGFDCDPTVDGRLQTKLATLLSERRFVALHAKIMALNQVHQVTRPIFLKKSAMNRESSEMMTAGFGGVYKKNNGLCDPDDTRSGTMDAADLGVLLRGLKQFHNMITPTCDDGSRQHGPCRMYNDNGVFDEALDGLEDSTRPVSIIPEDYELPNAPRDESTLGQRYFDLEGQLREDIAGVHGIPQMLIHHVGGNVRNMVDIMEQGFVRNTRIVAAHISRVLEFAYQAIYAVDEVSGGDSIAESVEPRVDPRLLQLMTRDAMHEWRSAGQFVSAYARDGSDAAGSASDSRSDSDNYSEHDAEDLDEAYNASTFYKDRNSPDRASKGKEKEKDDGDNHEDDEDVDRELSDVEEQDSLFLDSNVEHKTVLQNEEERRVTSTSSTRHQSRKRSRPDTLGDGNFASSEKPDVAFANSLTGQLKTKKSRGSARNADASRKHKFVSVQLNISSRVSLVLLQEGREQGALTPREYWSLWRDSMQLPVTEEVLNKLENERQKEMESGKPKADGKGKSSGSGGLSGVGKGGNQANSTPMQPRSQRKGNEKRAMKGRSTQATNARAGRQLGGAH